ncbi:alpha-amylase/4-alpha-glucanotransferase domain-containing protein [Thermovibrio sp.]
MGKLLFGIHNHQPVDNFMEVVEEAVERAYKPFLEEAFKVPEFKFSLHFSGWLFEKVKERWGELFKLIKKMVEREQVEIFTGGFYEPILPSIPRSWRLYQVEKLNAFIKENFGVEPKGLWLAERVWDESIVEELVECGVEYLVVDDYHFISVGFERKELWSYYITESSGKRLKVYPIDKRLRYLIPFRPVEEGVEYLKEAYGSRVLFDDGEKFGIWPGTYDWVYQKGWLKEFLQRVKEGEVETELFRENAKREKGAGVAYLPTASYYEMGRWSLPAERFKEEEEVARFLKEKFGEEAPEKFLRGGIWKNFFVKYKESNYMHKRMLHLAGLKVESEEFKEEVAKSQCNDVFWHGVFGGIYLPNLRDNFWRFTLRATEIGIREGKIKFPIAEDLDFDGHREVLECSGELLIGISEREGGSLIELSLLKERFNYQGVITRRKEGYHLVRKKRVERKEEGILTIHQLEGVGEVGEVPTDWHLKNSFITHLTERVSKEEFLKESFKELGDFANQPFKLKEIGEEIVLEREGGIYRERKYKTRVLKGYKLKGKELFFREEVESEYQGELLHLIELNLHFIDPEKVEFKRKERGVLIKDFGLKKEIEITSSRPFEFLVVPLETFNQREGGLERIVQGYSTAFVFKAAGESKVNLKLEVRDGELST